jgi:hypothetical protein
VDLGPLAQDERVGWRGHMGRDAQRDALRGRLSFRRASRVLHDLAHHAAAASGCPIMAASAARLVDAKWVETQLELAVAPS